MGDLPRWALVPELRQLFRPDQDSEPEDGEDFAGSGRWSFLARAASLLVRNWRDWLQNVRSWEGAKRELREQCAGLEPVVLESRSDWLARWNLLEERTVQVLRLHRWSVVLADYAFGVFRWLSRRLPWRISILLEDRVNLAASLPTAAANRGLREVLAGTASASEAHQFVAAYGHRSASLDFAVPTWRELLLEGQAKAHAQLSASEAAEAVPVKRRKRALLLRPLVRMLELREEQRFEWERVLAEQRRMIRSAGIELARRGILDSPDQVWFMTWNELLGALFDGIPIRSDELRLRRHEFRFNAKVRMPPFLGEQKEQVRQLGLELDGVGASRGRASGRVYLLRTPTALDARLPSGSVLVAKALDPSMTVLLQDVAAAVLERGGILSHASILAREYGVPLVTSVEGATEILATGMQVDVDGDRGVVTIDGWDHPGKDH